MLEFRQKNNSFSYYILYFSVTKKRSEIVSVTQTSDHN